MVHGAADRSVERPLQGGECHPTLRTGGETEKLTGQIWALAVNSKVVPLIMKNILCRLANWAGVRRRRPVLGSGTAPVARMYRE